MGTTSKEKDRKAKPKADSQPLQRVRGMHDMLPSDQAWIEHIRNVSTSFATFYNFSRIDTPILESAKLFERGVGEESDVITKEMYTLRTKEGGDLLALRPEGTAGVMRAYLENHLSRIAQPQKLFYEGPFFRHERPQAGRFRQFTQFGFEVIGGTNDPIFDAQVILIFQRILEDIGIQGIALKINSIGCRVCRPLYKRQLQTYYKPHEKKLCADCQRRFKTDPLKLLDCKHAECQEFKEKAPNFFDKLCVTCSGHLKKVLEYLDELKVSYTLDNLLVRGLDYYSRTVFEFFTEGTGLDAGAIAGGGRYDYLAELLGGRLTPAVGGAASHERLMYVMKSQQAKLPLKVPKKVFVIHVGDMTKKRMLPILEDLRKAGISISEAIGRESLKAQLKVADKEGIELALIFGQKELFEENIIIRNLKNSLQETVPLSRLVEEIKKRSRT